MRRQESARRKRLPLFSWYKPVVRGGARFAPFGSRRLGVEPLEARCLLAVASPQLELFSLSPALFVENQGQRAEPAVRCLRQGNEVGKRGRWFGGGGNGVLHRLGVAWERTAIAWRVGPGRREDVDQFSGQQGMDFQ